MNNINLSLLLGIVVLIVLVLIQIVMLVISAVFNNGNITRKNELEENRIISQNKLDDRRAEVLAQAVVLGIRQVFDDFVFKNANDSVELVVEIDENPETTTEGTD